ncbi:MAG: hypothetical protein DMF83_15615 [Acidobacteria bacterium]|nr:MAG: hypothetical protein DMF83_15615 [Acidobacteriota bacterium]
MNAWACVAVLSILGSLAYAESLGDVAKRERERREKKKQQGTETKVIHDEDLAAAPGKDSKGTFNPGTGFATGQGSAGASASAKSSAALLPSTSSSSGSGDITEVDFRRAGARQRLESSYATIAETAWSLVEAFREYAGCGEIPSRRCLSLATTVESLAMSVGASMEDAEEAARQGWLDPGEVRAVRHRYGMDDSFWDKLVSVVHQYRRR